MMEFGYVAARTDVRAISVQMGGGGKMFRDSNSPHCFEGIFASVDPDSRQSRTASSASNVSKCWSECGSRRAKRTEFS